MEGYNYSKLLGRIREKGFSQDRLAVAVNICPTTMNLSLRNRREFRQDEILNICEHLDIDLKDIAAYFFVH